MSVRGGGYDLKDTSYFAMARDDYVAALPENPEASILEIGCSNGATERWLSQGNVAATAAWSSSRAGGCRPREAHRGRGRRRRAGRAAVARRVVRRLDSERVLEHSARPWAVLERVRPCCGPARSCSPARPTLPTGRSSSCCSRALGLRATARSTDAHLRWFSRRVFGFEATASWSIRSGPLGALGPVARSSIRVLRGRLRHLWHRQIDLRAHVAQAPG